MKCKFTFLGTGASMGIPVIGCSCKVCSSSNQKDKRFRTSGLLTVNKQKILIDCGPDFREQALKYKINHLEGVMLTHAHQDHTGGIDELRAFLSKQHPSIPCLMSDETYRELFVRFNYIFSQKIGIKNLLPRLDVQLLPRDKGVVSFLHQQISYFSYKQAGMKVNGFRLGNFAYVTDIYDYEEDLFESLKGVEILVVSALRHSPSTIHFTADEALSFAEKVGAKKIYFTHISHDLSHDSTNAYLLNKAELAFDGMEIDFDL